HRDESLSRRHGDPRSRRHPLSPPAARIRCHHVGLLPRSASEKARCTDRARGRQASAFRNNRRRQCSIDPRGACTGSITCYSRCPSAHQTSAATNPGREPLLTRRHMMLASIAAGALMQNRDVLAKAVQPATAVNFDIPEHACDCHTHIHGDVEKFPFFAGRVYTPEPASPEEMSALHKALHMERVVIVTPSVY